MAKTVISHIELAFLQGGFSKPFDAAPGERSMLVTLEMPLNAPFQASLYFASNNLLDGENAKITGIEVVNAQELIKDPSGRSTLSSSVLPYGVLYISNLRRDRIAEIPLMSLTRQYNGNKIRFTDFDDQVWQNCYVEFTADAFSAPTVPLLFNVFYNQKQRK